MAVIRPGVASGMHIQLQPRSAADALLMWHCPHTTNLLKNCNCSCRLLLSSQPYCILELQLGIGQMWLWMKKVMVLLLLEAASMSLMEAMLGRQRVRKVVISHKEQGMQLERSNLWWTRKISWVSTFQW